MAKARANCRADVKHRPGPFLDKRLQSRLRTHKQPLHDTVLTRFGRKIARQSRTITQNGRTPQRTMEQHMSSTQQQSGASQPQPQQQGQTSPAPQQAAGTPAPKPVIRDWAAI
jgi:hypothetical protein